MKGFRKLVSILTIILISLHCNSTSYGWDQHRNFIITGDDGVHYIKFPVISTKASKKVGHRWETDAYKITMFPRNTKIPAMGEKEHKNCPIAAVPLKHKAIMEKVIPYESKRFGSSYVYIPIYAPVVHTGNTMTLEGIFEDSASKDNPVPILEKYVPEDQKEVLKKVLLEGGVFHIDPIFNIAYQGETERRYEEKHLTLAKTIENWGHKFRASSNSEWRMRHISGVEFPSKEEIFRTNILRTGTEEGFEQDTYELIVEYDLQNYPKIQEYINDDPLIIEGKLTIEGGHFVGEASNAFISGGLTMTEEVVKSWDLSDEKEEIVVSSVAGNSGSKGLAWLSKLQLAKKERDRRMATHTIQNSSNRLFQYKEGESIKRYMIVKWKHDGVSKKVTIHSTGTYTGTDLTLMDKETIEIPIVDEGLITFTGGEYYLDYDVRKEKFTHEVNGGLPFEAEVELPEKNLRNYKAWWADNTQGELEYTIEDPKGLIEEVEETQGYGPIDEGNELIIREPTLTWETDKIDVFGGLGVGKAESKEASFFIHTEGGISRLAEYSYETSYTETEEYTDSDGNKKTRTVTKYETNYGDELVTDRFNSHIDEVSVQGLFFNGSKMPLQSFGGQIGSYEDNKHRQAKRTLVWEGDRYNIPVKRFMRYVDEKDKTTDIVEEDGYGGNTRIFQHIDRAEVTYTVNTSLNEHFQSDREKARNNPNNHKMETFYHAPFATDGNLQGYNYPIKSGYFYAPYGVYEVKVRTTIYKEGDGKTQKHKDIVDQIKESFSPTISLPTMKANGDAIIGLGGTKYDELPIRVDNDYFLEEEYKLPYSNGPASVGQYLGGSESTLLQGTDPLYKKILQGWNSSGSSEYWNTYNYREYIQSANIYKITEETILTFTLNPSKQRYYIVPQTKNGNYNFTIGFKPFDNGYVTVGSTIQSKPVTKLDDMTFTIVGSMYDDQSSR